MAEADNLKLAKLLLKAMWLSHHPNHSGEGLCQNPLLNKFFLNIPVQGYKNSEQFQVSIIHLIFIAFSLQVIVNYTSLNIIISIVLFFEFFFEILTLQDNLYFVLINLHNFMEF